MEATTVPSPGFERRGGFACYVGRQEPTAADIEEFFDGLAKLRKEVAAAGEAPPFPLLADCADVRRVGAEARAVTYRRKAEVGDWRIAVVGHTVFQRLLVEFLRLATGARHVKYFTDEADARDWLVRGGK